MLSALARSLPVLAAALLALGGCGDDDGGGPTDAGRDGDRGDALSCVQCAAPPPGCHLEGGSCTSCGALVCEDAGTSCVDCPIPSGCRLEGGSCTSCGTLVCEDAGTSCVDCAAPPPGCRLEGGSCTSCGTLVCEDAGTPVSCGARAGDTCAADEFCAYEPGALCGAADATAVCRPRPESCTAVEDPVCGCDGHTYSNACVAAMAGTGYASSGPCGAPPDCRDAGCSSGSSCEACLGAEGIVYVCIPAGAAC